MKHEYRRIVYTRSERGWQAATVQSTIWLHAEDAAAKNRRFFETGVKYVSISGYVLSGYSPRDRQQLLGSPGIKAMV